MENQPSKLLSMLHSLGVLAWLLLLSLAAIALRGDARSFSVALNRSAIRDGWGEISASAAKIVENLISYRSITIEGLERYTAPEIFKLIDLPVGASVLSLPPREIRHRLLQLAWIERADISTEFFPLRMRIGVKEAKPWVVAEVKGESWLVSREGHLLQSLAAISSSNVILETMELPRLDGIGTNADLEEALRQVKLLEDQGGMPWPPIRYSLVDGPSLKVWFSEVRPEPAEEKCPMIAVFISARSEEAARVSIERLAAVTADLRRKGELVDTVDLRFKNQAVITGLEAKKFSLGR